MSQTQAIEKQDSKAVEYIPYGNQDKVKLSIAIVQNLIAVKTKSGKTCSEKDAIKFMAMCQAKRLNPFEGDAYLIGYDAKDGPAFSLITAHQTYLKRAELHPEFDGMQSGLIVKEAGELKNVEGDFYTEGQEVVGGWATVFFKNRKQPMSKRLRLERFRKPFGIWLDDAAGMICKCAEADALRSAFPTMLGGLYMREEIDSIPSMQVSRPDFTSAKPLFVEHPKNGGSEAVDVEVAPETSPEPEPPVEQPAGINPVKAVRNLCKESKIKEPILIGFLFEIGSAQANYETLEQLHLSQPDLLKTCVDQWTDISRRILAAIGGATGGRV